MEKTRILFVSHTFPPIVGGVESHNYELSTWLSKQADINPHTNNSGNSLSPANKKNIGVGVKLIVNKKRWLIPFFLVYAAIYAALLAKKYDVIVLGSCLLCNVGWFTKKFTKKPVIAVAHGLDLTFKNFLYQKLWVNIFLQKIDKIIAVGNETVRIAKEKGVAENKIVFIPNGVDTEKHLISATKNDLEKIVGQSIYGKKILLTSGRLAKRKGVVWFISNVMPKLGEEFLYVVVGDGPDKENIKNAIKNTNLENRVITLGYIPDKQRNILLNTADLFLQPNIKIPGDMEGFGISVIEAGACRLPVLASNMEGLKDAIKEGQNGFLVESENGDAFIQKINKLFSEGNPREIFGEKVREYVVQNYSWKNIAQKYLEEIEKTIKK